ncbi:hypothetical protein DVH05_008761 [Phytophthora capsici]|nr:hypothetical protein DVH05_003060 [Phytophthora capsici]KAG1711509.1 hypothetical protein DVH05_008761 [Phytophthora capsici]
MVIHLIKSEVEVRLVCMFEVQITTGVRGRLQALRRRFSMTVSSRNFEISLLSASSSAAVVIRITRSRIKSVRVRGRLLRITVDRGEFLTVRLQNADETLRAAEEIMLAWDIDPLVEGWEVSAPDTEEQEDFGVGKLVSHYMNDQEFRGIIQEIHDHIDVALGNRESSYEVRL